MNDKTRMTNDGLPNGWASTTLSEVSDRGKYGWTTKAAQQGDVKFLRTTDITKGPINWSTVPFCAETPSDIESYLVRPRDILISRAGSVGFSALIQEVERPTVFASYLIRFVPSKYVEERFLAAFLRSPDYWDQISDASAGIALVNVNASQLSQISLPLAPLAEQKRIADKLEAVLGRVDACRTRLDRVPTLLKRFRQSVLAAAVSGKLTGEWRNARKISAALQSFQIGEDALDVPKTWETGLLRDLLDPSRPLCYGVVQPGEETAGGSLLIRVQDLENGSVNVADLRTISKRVDLEYRRFRIQEGDLLISVVGTIGRTAIVPANLEANIARAIARLACRKGVESRWVNYWLSCDTLQWWLSSSSKEVARKTLNLSELGNTPVALPPSDEQQEIVRRVEALFALADRIEARLATAQKTVDRLTPATLAKAFRGELVPQDPNDEPTAALLERIRKQIALTPTITSRKRVATKKTRTAKKSITAMKKSRFDDDVKNQPYLANLIKGASDVLDAENLHKASQLRIADFYKQLAWEIEQGLIEDDPTKLKATT